MRITALKTFLVPPRWLFLKIETDEGVSGWGEPVLEGHAETLATQVAEFGDFLIGQDPGRIGDIWQMLYRNGCYRGGPVLMSALAGIDTALWDIKGRVLGQPIHALLAGGKGTVAGTMLAVLLLAVLSNGMNLLGIQTFYQLVAKGLLLVVAVAIGQWRMARAERRQARLTATGQG